MTSAVVVENGSAFMKSGFSGNNAPTSVIPTIIGTFKEKYKEMQNMMGVNNIRVGKQAKAMRSLLDIKYPINFGLIDNFDDIQQIYHHIFYNELRIAPEEHDLMIAYDVGTGTSYPKEKLTQISFESFNVPRFYLAYQQKLAAYASGRTTGLIVDSGYQKTVITPIWEGHFMFGPMKRLYFGGNDITQYLKKLLTEKGYEFKTAVECDIVDKMKESLTYIADNNYETELSKHLCRFPEYLTIGYLRSFGQSYDESLCKIFDEYVGDFVKDKGWRKMARYELPDGKYIELNDEQFKCAELLFDNDLIANKGSSGSFTSIADGITQCILRCDKDMRKDMMSNIIICGGNTMFQGFRHRLYKEMRKSSNIYKDDINIICPKERKYSVWIGGSILTSLSVFKDMWVSKGEYDESGSSIVHRKCFT